MTEPEPAAVVVVGSINMDLRLTLPRLPGPGETLAADDLDHHQGGKGANQAVAAARAGAAVQMVGCVGDDEFGGRLIASLADTGVATDQVEVVGGPSGLAVVCVDEGGENFVVVLAGANGQFSPGMVERAVIPDGAWIVLQNEVAPEVNRAALARARAVAGHVVYNPAPAATVTSDVLALVDVLVVNESEFALIFDVHESALSDDDATFAAVSSRCEQFSTHGADHDTHLEHSAADPTAVVVTLGGAGVMVVSHGDVRRFDGHPVDAVDTTGAGDCFVGYLAARLGTGEVLAEAIVLANAAAALSVTREGAGPSMPTLDEVRRFLA